MRPGMRVGLLGGSFDPAHEGHARISTEALKRLQLDAVVWLFSPQNPLKHRSPDNIQVRMAEARRIVHHPRIGFSNLEEQIGTRFTHETLFAITQAFPKTHFVWLMGADNLTQFHKWEAWDSIAHMVPIAVLARPGDRLKAKTSRTARILRTARIPALQIGRLSMCPPPAWCFVNIPMMDISSSTIRAERLENPAGNSPGARPSPLSEPET